MFQSLNKHTNENANGLLILLQETALVFVWFFSQCVFITVFIFCCLSRIGNALQMLNENMFVLKLVELQDLFHLLFILSNVEFVNNFSAIGMFSFFFVFFCGEEKEIVLSCGCQLLEFQRKQWICIANERCKKNAKTANFCLASTKKNSRIFHFNFWYNAIPTQKRCLLFQKKKKMKKKPKINKVLKWKLWKYLRSCYFDCFILFFFYFINEPPIKVICNAQNVA